jgi:hypothetical protein
MSHPPWPVSQAYELVTVSARSISSVLRLVSSVATKKSPYTNIDIRTCSVRGHAGIAELAQESNVRPKCRICKQTESGSNT